MKTTAEKPRNKRGEKRQVNISWNSRLFFQIGIIVSSLLVFFLMQTQFETATREFGKASDFAVEEPPIINYELDVDKPKPIIPIKRDYIKPVKQVKTPLPIKSDTYLVTDNSSTEPETTIPPTDSPAPEPEQPVVPDPGSHPSGPTSILNVEFVPVYPGCESLASNAEKIECLSSKINFFINRNFRKELLENLGSNQPHKVYVQFKIDTHGFITEVRANSTNLNLKNEAMRVVAKLPQMTPGRQGNKTVDVVYTVPIVFQIP